MRTAAREIKSGPDAFSAEGGPIRIPLWWFYRQFGPSVHVYPAAGFTELGLFGEELPLWEDYLRVSAWAHAVVYPDPYLRQAKLKIASELFREKRERSNRGHKFERDPDGYLRLERENRV